MIHSIKRLDRAIREVLGGPVYEALQAGRGLVRPRLHDMACMTAFRLDLQTENAKVLRDMHLALGRTGFYPAESWDSDDE